MANRVGNAYQSGFTGNRAGQSRKPGKPRNRGLQLNAGDGHNGIPGTGKTRAARKIGPSGSRKTLHPNVKVGLGVAGAGAAGYGGYRTYKHYEPKIHTHMETRQKARVAKKARNSTDANLTKRINRVKKVEATSALASTAAGLTWYGSAATRNPLQSRTASRRKLERRAGAVAISTGVVSSVATHRKNKLTTQRTKLRRATTRQKKAAMK